MPKPKPLPVAFGHAVRRLREGAGLSQEKLGEKTELTRNYIGMIERGETNPTLTVMLSLATALDTTVTALVREAEEGQTPEVKPPSGDKKKA